MRGSLLITCVGAVGFACSSTPAPEVVATAPPTISTDRSTRETPPTVDDRVTFYERKLAEHPGLFAGHAQLGLAYLDKARETHDVRWLTKARASLARSLEIQPNLNALVGSASACNFAHQFACALEFAERAARANPLDARIFTLRAEALLGLGRLDAVEEMFDASSRGGVPQLVVDAARGRWLAEQERYDEARTAFLQVAEAAGRSGGTDLQIWALTNAAGMMIDSERSAPARPHLEAAARIPAGSPAIQTVLRIHWAELSGLEGDPSRALDIYETLLRDQPDPELFRRAFILARQLGRTERAEALFAQGEAAAVRIEDAGEIFALEARAGLYAASRRKLLLALELASRNLEYKRDRSARETYAELEALAAGTSPAP